MPTAALYLRHNTSDNATELQRIVLQSLAHRHGYSVGFIYADGSKAVIALDLLVAEVKGGGAEFQALFITSTTRFYNPAWIRSRNIRQAEGISIVFAKAQIEIITFYPSRENIERAERARREDAAQTRAEMEYMTRNMRTRY